MLKKVKICLAVLAISTLASIAVNAATVKNPDPKKCRQKSLQQLLKKLLKLQQKKLLKKLQTKKLKLLLRKNQKALLQAILKALVSLLQ